jgi:hypothetical protein
VASLCCSRQVQRRRLILRRRLELGRLLFRAAASSATAFSRAAASRAAALSSAASSSAAAILTFAFLEDPVRGPHAGLLTLNSLKLPSRLQLIKAPTDQGFPHRAPLIELPSQRSFRPGCEASSMTHCFYVLEREIS